MTRLAVLSKVSFYAAAFTLVSFLGSQAAEAACNTSPGVGVDWTKCEKRRLNLSGQDLSRGVFLNTDFGRTDLKDARFVNADLSMADFAKARLAGADLSGAKMVKTQGDRADFTKAKLVGVDMTKAEMSRTDFSGADFTDAVMIKAELGRASLVDAKLDRVDLSRAEIARAIFKGASLIDSNFEDAYTYLTRFEGADLSQAKGLEQFQLDVACGDDDTVLPEGMERPAHWPCAEE
ncbi:pentapeptide repeat-containing protein [Pelagibius sp.]|uniref:pentapeptide repeat-containing protein n=1 Tax=Pelagibius sp. TaxID=1931238 RepID=UPI003BAFDC29